jgi:hypothetical protein
MDGRIAIQISDLDQTAIGNPAHDIIRLALSLATASHLDPGGVVLALVFGGFAHRKQRSGLSRTPPRRCQPRFDWTPVYRPEPRGL